MDLLQDHFELQYMPNVYQRQGSNMAQHYNISHTSSTLYCMISDMLARDLEETREVKV